MTRDPDDPIPGAGLRHALAMTVTLLAPLAYSVTAAAASAIDGLSQPLVIAVTLLTGIAASLVSVAFPLPSVRQVLARLAIVVVVAVGVRFTVPTPSIALAEVRAGEAPIFAGTALLMLVLMGVAYVLGHGLTYQISLLATAAPTTAIARQRERRTLVVWWGGMALLIFVAGLTPETGGTTASVLIGLSALVTLGLLADLRLRTPPPGATRQPVVAAPRRIRLAAVVFAGIATVAFTALLAPVVPLDALRSPPTMPGWLDLDFGRDIGAELGEAITGADEPQEVEDPPPTVPERDWTFPTIPWQVLAVLGALVLYALLRPHRWKLALRRLWRVLQRSRLLRGDDAGGEVLDLDDADVDAEEHGEHGRLRRILERIRPRPRDPRLAVLYDYFHVERILAKDDRGRENHETPHEHAVRVHVSEAHEELADLAADARFARAAPDAAAVARSRELRREIEQGLRTSRD